MRLEAELSFTYESEQEAESIVKAVSPDNVKVPIGLSVKMMVSNCHSQVSVSCEKSLETLLATLDDLLACMSTAERTLKTIKMLKLQPRR